MPAERFDLAAVIESRPWLDRAIERIAPAWGAQRLQARVSHHLFAYQAARADRIFNPRTSGQPAESLQTARDRQTMMFEARDLVENFAPAKVILAKFAENVTPTEYVPATGDRDYDRILSDYFHDWCRVADFEGRHSFRKLVDIAVQTRPVDGDCGFILRRMADDQLRVQLVAGDRIGSPTEISTADNYFSGITVDRFGRPVSYRIFRVTRTGTYAEPEEVPRDRFFHYADQFRIDQYRGVTDFHSALRTARMLKDILEAEQVGVKFAAQQAALIFNTTGTPPARNLFTATPTQTLPNGEARQDEYSEFGALRYLQTTDRVEVMPSRPGSAFQGFTDLLMDHFALGVSVSRGVLFGTKDYKGPSVRSEFAQADRTFTRHRANISAKLLLPVREAVFLNGIAIGDIPPPPRRAGETVVASLRRMLRGEFRFPAKLTIDVGRESEANINENTVGAKSLQEIAAEQDADAFTRLEENAQVAAEVKRLAEKYEVPETTIRLIGKQLPSTPAAAAAQGEHVGEAAAEAQAGSVPSAAAPAKPGAAPSSPESADDSEDDPEADPAMPPDIEASRPRPRPAVADLLRSPSERRAPALERLAARVTRHARIRTQLGQTTRTAAEIAATFDKLRK